MEMCSTNKLSKPRGEFDSVNKVNMMSTNTNFQSRRYQEPLGDSFELPQVQTKSKKKKRETGMGNGLIYTGNTSMTASIEKHHKSGKALNARKYGAPAQQSYAMLDSASLPNMQ